MRLYVSILAVAALSTTACGKKAEQPKPEPAKTEQPAKEEPKKGEPAAEAPKKEEPKKEEPVAEAPKKEEPVAEVKADRVAVSQKAFADWAAGKMEDTYATFTDDAVRHNVGDQQTPEVKGKQAIIDHSKAMHAQLSDIKLSVARIIDAGDMQLAEYVLSGNMKVKGADGAEAMKPVTVPGAILLAFNAEGKVTEMWQFADQASMLMQAGVIPGLPEGFTAVKHAESTEVVKGPANDALLTAYKALGEKFKPDTIDAAVAEHLADDFTSVDSRTGKTVGKADLAAHLKGMMTMFADMTNTVDKSFSAGEYLVTVCTSTATYKGGIPGAEAKDQKVTMHTLEVSRIADGKFKSWAGYENGMEIAAQLGLGGAAEKPAGDAPAAGGDKIGIAECDLYMSKMTECLSKVPDAMKGTFEQGMKSAVDGWKQAITAGGDAAKGALAGACKQMVDTTKQATAQLCPDVKWE